MIYSIMGGGGSCRRQGKSAAPRGRRAWGGGWMWVRGAVFGNNDVNEQGEAGGQ